MEKYKKIIEDLNKINDSLEISETIKHEGNSWVLYTKDGSKVLGKHPTKAEAIAQEQAIEISKHSS
jgi:hypothetical protein